MKLSIMLLAGLVMLAVAFAAETETGRDCFDGKDNDGDGKTDCEDRDCLKDRRIRQRCRQSGHGKSKGKGKKKDDPHTETGRECTDYKDNDGDGKADCEDSDCLAIANIKKKCDRWAKRSKARRDPNPRAETKWECFDHLDNDHDGKTDCLDPDCTRDARIRQRCQIEMKKINRGKGNKGKHDNPHTETGKECRDGKDNDGDGKSDCDDPDCLKNKYTKKRCDKKKQADSTETGRECRDRMDNDHDGKTDCQDPDCLKQKGMKKWCDAMGMTSEKTETGRECTDYIDNDHDGKTDCEDSDCLKIAKVKKWCDAWARSTKKRHDRSPRTETGRECMDHVDNDHDGKTDCMDPDCMRDRRMKQRCQIMMSRIKHQRDGTDDPHTETGKECRDGKDNDGDGKSDCEDKDCMRHGGKTHGKLRCPGMGGGH